jgi:hypothetical protein
MALISRPCHVFASGETLYLVLERTRMTSKTWPSLGHRFLESDAAGGSCGTSVAMVEYVHHAYFL